MTVLFEINWNHARCSMPRNYECNLLFGYGSTRPTIEAKDAKDAVERFAADRNFNPFYLEAKPCNK